VDETRLPQSVRRQFTSSGSTTIQWGVDGRELATLEISWKWGGGVKSLGRSGERDRAGAYAQIPCSCREKFCTYLLKMKKNTIKRPPKLSPAEKKQWDQVVEQMTERGIDPASRLELITDYVKLAARIERLSAREDDPELGNIQTSRAVNVAVAERRRLHAALFAGAGKPEPVPTPAKVAYEDAFWAWVGFRGEGWIDDPAEFAAREAELTRRYGEEPMMAMCVPCGASREEAQRYLDLMTD
jgi:hypothetical protein